MSSSIGDDSTLSGAKLEPLKSNDKQAESSDGSVGTDANIDEARIEPMGGAGQYQHPKPRADSQGSAGRDEVIQGAKIDPMQPAPGVTNPPAKGGLDDENVDASRIEPMGEVREEMS